MRYSVVNRIAALERIASQQPAQRDPRAVIRKMMGHPEAYRAALALHDYMHEAGIPGGEMDAILANPQARRLASSLARELAMIDERECGGTP